MDDTAFISAFTSTCTQLLVQFRGRSVTYGILTGTTAAMKENEPSVVKKRSSEWDSLSSYMCLLDQMTGQSFLRRDRNNPAYLCQ